MKKYIIIFISVLLVLIGVLRVFRKDKKASDEEALKIVEVARGDLLSTISATGVLEPKMQIKLTSPKRGQVDEIMVEEGDRVRKGQRVAIISSEDRINLIDAARMNLEKANSTGSQAAIAEAENELRIAETAYQPIPILVPIDGLVTFRNIEPGEKVNANTIIIEVSDKIIVKVLIDETDIGKVSENMKVKIILDAYPDEVLWGKISKIAYSPTIESNVTNYEALIEITSRTDKLLKSGMTVDVEIISFEKKDVLLLPVKAVKEKKGRKIVLVPGEGGKPYPQKVKTGKADEDNIEIISGIEEGEKVMIIEKIDGMHKAPPGAGKSRRSNPSRQMRHMMRGKR